MSNLLLRVGQTLGREQSDANDSKEKVSLN